MTPMDGDGRAAVVHPWPWLSQEEKIDQLSTFTIDGAMNMADSWCGQYGLIAKETQILFATDSLQFACIPPHR
jgi:hypothetical protein